MLMRVRDFGPVGIKFLADLFVLEDSFKFAHAVCVGVTIILK